MVDPEYAGVMFTLDPIYKKDILIEVVEGLGEKLVSGQVTPNTFFLDKKTFKINDENIMFELDKKILIPIAKIGLKIEDHYGYPQDIEFAINKNKKLFILQSRAITTL
jgi:pyruvate,water dikinase